ncbi:putative activating signal cointegrator 1 complex subunit 3 [Toxoplasma gondii RUB]|uniref:Putative activating signal cointegrator 1 complex subunit 3 n=1 Tax=Toxoplasma gondii RUB TaxID=935652 RepID=A0A086M5S4_TOXGO|nr:putative activating signal cointegrator 1 complex subunit 3 [Toxoplasma gondii RUB]
MDDPELCALRRKLIVDAAETLHKHRLIRFNSRTQRLDPTNLGRMACRYYVDYETASLFRQDVELGVDEDRVILRLLGLAKEFASLKVRDDEESELSNLRRSAICRVPIVGDFDAPEAKVQTLVQAALAQAPIKAFSLCADSNYVQAVRIYRFRNKEAGRSRERRAASMRAHVPRGISRMRSSRPTVSAGLSVSCLFCASHLGQSTFSFA